MTFLQHQKDKNREECTSADKSACPYAVSKRLLVLRAHHAIMLFDSRKHGPDIPLLRTFPSLSLLRSIREETSTATLVRRQCLRPCLGNAPLPQHCIETSDGDNFATSPERAWAHRFEWLSGVPCLQRSQRASANITGFNLLQQYLLHKSFKTMHDRNNLKTPSKPPEIIVRIRDKDEVKELHHPDRCCCCTVGAGNAPPWEMVLLLLLFELVLCVGKLAHLSC